jgi:endoribonuclease Nob1
LSSSDSSEFVLDASAFYAGIPFQSSKKCITTNAVYEEVKHIRRSYSPLEALIDAGNLIIIEPEMTSLNKVIACARKTGDCGKLSQADISIIALALELGKTLISDDFAVGNVATFLKIPVRTLAFKGISELRAWISFCNSCARVYNSRISVCQICGSKLRRRFTVITDTHT